MNLRRLILWIMLVVVIAGAAAAWLQRGESSPPLITPPPLFFDAMSLGITPRELQFDASDFESGLRSLAVTLEQGESITTLLDENFAGDIYRGGKEGTDGHAFALSINAKELGLKEGEAALVVTARDWSWNHFFKGNETVFTLPIIVDLKAPRLSIENGLTYIRKGGSAAAVYTVYEPTARDGVLVGSTFYRGFPLREEVQSAVPQTNQPTKDTKSSVKRRIAIFAIPAEGPDAPPISVVVEDRAGNSASNSWQIQILPMEQKAERIELNEKFLQNAVPNLAQTLQLDASDPVATFQKINTEVRAANEAKIREVIGKSVEFQHWRGPFRQMLNSAVKSNFAERRTYFIGEQEISQATHYGYDLASTANAYVTAANSGVIIYADDLGIYGQCVIIDHGIGVYSLYGHLSQIDAKVGEKVDSGVTIGRTGATGLAGGDHLHFAILVGQTYVDPKEWWDPKWVEEHVTNLITPPASNAESTEATQ